MKLNFKAKEHFDFDKWVVEGIRQAGNQEVKPTDIDGALYCNGQLLIMEAKYIRNGDRQEIPFGQYQVYRALWNRGCTILYVWLNEDGNPLEMEVFYNTDCGVGDGSFGSHQPRQAVSREAAIEFIRNWWLWAEENPTNL